MKNKKRAKQLLHNVKRHFHLQPSIKQAMMASYQNRHTAGERERESGDTILAHDRNNLHKKVATHPEIDYYSVTIRKRNSTKNFCQNLHDLSMQRLITETNSITMSQYPTDICVLGSRCWKK